MLSWFRVQMSRGSWVSVGDGLIMWHSGAEAPILCCCIAFLSVLFNAVIGKKLLLVQSTIADLRSHRVVSVQQFGFYDLGLLCVCVCRVGIP